MELPSLPPAGVFKKLFPYIVLALFALLVLTVLRTSVFGTVEPEQHLYFEIVFLLLLALLGEIAVEYLKQPSVMILMVLGILISPSFFSVAWGALHLPGAAPSILQNASIISVFAQLGAVILLFKVGLHNKLEGVFAFDNLLVAVAGVIVPFAVGYLYASSTGGNFAYSMFLGAALTATSVGVTAALLKEFGLLGQRFAQVIIGAAIIDDILGLLVLSLVLNIAGGAVEIDPLLVTGMTAAVFVLGSILAGKHFVKYIDSDWSSGSRAVLLALAFMLSYAYIAEFIRLSAIVGAFMAGIVLNRSRHIKEIEQETSGLELLFVPIFFISLGLMVDVNALAEFAVPILVLTVIAFATKVVPCYLAALFAKLKQKEALAVGVGMVPRGEVALIIASLGLSTGVLGAAQYSIISAMALLSTFIVPPILSRVLKK
ncbi:MAG: cation:proton antiporter [Candidatus Micrarchaeota archaeon]|nr:cation:proton antiporter [Candidatus Micrarchaeota archaeon]